MWVPIEKPGYGEVALNLSIASQISVERVVRPREPESYSFSAVFNGHGVEFLAVECDADKARAVYRQLCFMVAVGVDAATQRGILRGELWGYLRHAE